ncbi:MAG: hypothetical protein ACRC6M_16690 [Microcystaceae cyanobacterium]
MVLLKFSWRYWIGLNLFLWFPTAIAVPPVFAQPVTILAASSNTQTINLPLLKQALATFFQATTFQVESTVKIKVEADQSAMEVSSQTNTVTVLPRRFVSEIKLGNQQYFITSDGIKVWIFHRNKDEYTDMAFNEFQDSEDSFLIGLASSFLLEIVRSLQEEKITKEINPDELVAAILSFFTKDFNQQGLTLSQDSYTADGKDYTRYHYKANSDDLELVLWVDTAAQQLTQLQVIGSDQGVKVNIQEIITKQIFNPTVDENSFRFKPSPGLKRVDSLPLEPF